MADRPLLNYPEIARRRKALDLSMEAAANSAGFTHRQQWGSIESGERADIQLSTLAKIAAALHCQPAELLAKSPAPRRKK